MLGGGSDILRQVLYVFRSNNLATELDRSVQQQPADWRVRAHKARRRAFLVVRSLVRLKREVKHLGAPFKELGWLMPVAAQERWGELKALAARCRQLEAAVLDADVAINQLTALKEMQSKAAAPASGTAGRANGRASPSRGALRSRAGRVSGTGGVPDHRIAASGGRAVSESGAMQSRGRLRTPLTADPPPPPTAGGRAGRLANSAQPGVAHSSPFRSPMTGRKGGAGGAEVLTLVPPSSAPHGALVPSMSPMRGPSQTGGPLSSPFGRAGPANTAAGTPPGARGPAGGGILSGVPSPTGAPATPPSPSARALLREITLGGLGGPRTLMTSNTFMVRQTFIINHDKDAHSAVGPLPPVQAGRTGSGTQILEISSSSMPDTAAHSALSDAADVFHNNNAGDGITFSASSLAPPAGPNLGSHRPPGAAMQGSESALMTGARSPAAAARTWGLNVEPAPPGAPLPTSAGRRPLGALAHSGGGAGSPGGPVAALPSAGSASAPVPPSLLASVTPGTSPLSPPTANGSSALRPHLSVGGLNGAPPVDTAPASVAPALPCLIQDGENLDQALARFKLAADDTRNALVDTSRQFRAVLDLCNSHWPDQRWWLAAHTQDEAASDSWPTSDEFVVNRADVVRCLKAGVVAFQFICYADEPVTGPSGNRFDLWTADPWELAADLAPEKVSRVQTAPPPHPLAPKPAANGTATGAAANGSSAAASSSSSERLVGMPLGVRILQQLANSVAEVAGPSALENLPIILHVSERQREAIVADLLQYSIYRRLRKNLYIVVQRSHPVMRFDPACNAYVPVEGEQPTYSPGTGFSMLQLLWGGHALTLNDAGELERLPHSLMQELRTRQTEWFVSRTCADLSLLLEDGALDMRSLAHVSYMWSQPHMRYSLAVETACTYVNHRNMIARHGSVLLCRKPKVLGMVMGRLDGAVRVDRYGGGTKAQLPVVELLTCELNSAHMQHELAEAASARSTTTSVGLGRYIFRFEVLDKLLTGPTVLRPKLLPVVDAAVHKSALKKPIEVANAAAEAAAAGGPTSAPPPVAPSSTAMAPFSVPGCISESLLAHAASQGMDTVMLRLHLSMTDLTMHHAIKVVALKANREPILIKGKEDGAALVELLSKSDVDLKTATQRLAAKLPSFSRQQKPGQNILVFAQDNGVSLTATNVAVGLARRERGDRIHLVTVVASDAQRGEGSALLERMIKASRTQADIMTHVLDQEGRGLLECVADVVNQYNCEILVVGSTSITSAAPTPTRGATPSTPSKAPRTPAGRSGAGGATAGLGVSAMDDAANSEMLLSSVALSIMRTFQLPVILVTANTRNYLKRGGDAAAVPGKTTRPSVGGVGGAPTGSRLACMALVERHSRPMMHHLAKLLLEPSMRQDTLVLAQLLPPGMAPGNKDYDPTCIQAVALKTLMANFETIAAANDFHTPAKALVQGEWHNALCAAVRDAGTQLLALQLAPGTTRSLSPMLLQLVRSCPCPVLIYPERVIIPGTGLLMADTQ
ncbi:hypothetical protein HYH02_001686 [Chlamydomonas schloesseri]|uniref:Uncharacterized protein n=1 Tax=Chlamydomonas schloesseri TaxID=2026947 RepID=A0A835WW00_9CHLO|nr:hypothetical protein HYH02_001686 [Chlamydomonas schloesseri]|eukprot:KAG2453465.1 hypothetical protein HYH02_001686 [Chlamydomonas schloesseri]